MANPASLPPSPTPGDGSLEALLLGCTEGTKASFDRLAATCLPRMLGLAYLFFEQPHHGEAVCGDMLLLAWRNLDQWDARQPAATWLYTILGSRLYTQLLAIHGSRREVAQRLEGLGLADMGTMSSPTGPRPSGLSGDFLQALAETTPPVTPTERFRNDMETLITAEINQRHSPRTPTGERAYPPLYDPALRHRMLKSRIAFTIKEGFKRRLGGPLENGLLHRWLESKPGSAMLEAQGLPRRSIEAYLDGKLDLEVDTSVLHKGINFPRSFPNRALRRKASNVFIWPGDWDLVLTELAESDRREFITDLWQHRLDLTASHGYARLLAALERGAPVSSHRQGILLNSEARILTYLQRYRLYMEDMSCFGFKASMGSDRLGVAIDRDGNLIKINKGLHRLAMAQVLGIQRVTVRIRAIHQLWWLQKKGRAEGKAALANVESALATLANRQRDV
ncbi:RNA polymerase sigma factor [Billgrantia endophytica]|uniref:Uncharacterized protein n=1 Tax=Billgrantia endophytica TaxID=2033802 RepID=A0A2N7U7N6_9GAMM|nr:hypothetical protein [Halomonas endophytica]PMR76440.1 hypothetical protein C1H69_05170 [Halomonas endophytica]